MQNEVARDPLIGTVVDRYIIRRPLASGGMGAVYVAEHSRSGATKAVKVLHPEFARNPTIRARFETEAATVMGIKDKDYIVGIHNYGELPDGQLFLLMDLLEGETLEAHIQRRGRCSLHFTVHIMGQVMSALDSLHTAHVIHRDLKPANIFITRGAQNHYHVRLLDLGIARNLAEEAVAKKTITGVAMGTPGFMAPEQYEDASSAGVPADVYAAGVTAWAMLFGAMPWGDVSGEQVLYYRQRMEHFVVPQMPVGHEIPADVVTLLRKMLASAPGERPSLEDSIITLASLTPAIPPFVPSGAAILKNVASKFITQASATDATVRNVSHGDVLPSVHWPPRDPAWDASPVPDIIEATPTPKPSMPPTANHRPAAAITPPHVSVSSMHGVVATPSLPTARPPRTSLMVVVAVIFVAIVATVTALVVNAPKAARVDRSPDGTATPQPIAVDRPAAASPPFDASVVVEQAASTAPSDAMTAPPSQITVPDAGVASPVSEKTTPRSNQSTTGDRTAKQAKPKTADKPKASSEQSKATEQPKTPEQTKPTEQPSTKEQPRAGSGSAGVKFDRNAVFE